MYRLNIICQDIIISQIFFIKKCSDFPRFIGKNENKKRYESKLFSDSSLPHVSIDSNMQIRIGH